MAKTTAAISSKDDKSGASSNASSPSDKGKGKAVPTKHLPPRKRATAFVASQPPIAEPQPFFSPRNNRDIQMEELDGLPVSDIRTAPMVDMSKMPAKKRPYEAILSFNEINIAPPIPSKRHRNRQETQERRQSPVYHSRQKHEKRQREQQPSTNASSSSSSSQQSPPPPSSATTTAPTLSSAPAVQQQKPSIPSTSPVIINVSTSIPSTSTAAATTTTTPTNTTVRSRRGPEFAYPRESLNVPLKQDAPVVDDTVMNSKAKEKEYWRRQRRVFVRSRFITDDEATVIANSVYKSEPVDSKHRFVQTLQSNVANFRSKWRKHLKERASLLKIPKDIVENPNPEELRKAVAEKVDHSVLHEIWGHWILDPFVGRADFYANQQSVDILTKVTIDALCVTLRHQHNLLKNRDFRKALDDLDSFTRTMDLPDPLAGTM